MIKICDKCKKEFHHIAMIDGRERNLHKRKFCLECSPFGAHNTKNLNDNSNPLIDGKVCARCDTHKKPDEFYRRREYKELSPYCKICTNNQTVERQRGMKKMAVDYKGGKCFNCEYDKCLAALDFHHLDPSKKDFSISMAKHTTFDKIKDELDKCMLVCSNCHREIHWLESRETELKFSQVIIKKEKGPDMRLKENKEAPPARKKKIEWPSPDEMSKLIWELSTVQLAKKLGVSDSAIGKFCKVHKIQKPPRGYWRKFETGNI